MSYSGEAADQVVRLSLNGVEVAAKLSGSAAKQIAVMLYAIMKDQTKTKGKIRLTNMLRSGKELKVFAVKDEDLKHFCEAAKKYGVLYCVLRDKNAKDGVTDIMVRAEDASKINRIYERFNLTTVDRASIRADVVKAKDKNEELQVPERTAPEKDKEEEFLDALFKKPTPTKEEAQTRNPTEGRTTKSRQSEPTSPSKPRAAGGRSSDDEYARPSVKRELREIKEQQSKNAETLLGDLQRQEPTLPLAHIAPKKKNEKGLEK